MTDNGRPRRWRPVVLLLVVPLIAVLIPEFYNFNSPAIGGMPFFYWYQLAWVAGVAVCTAIVYFATRSTR
ncbi:MAG TPA: DUF3311 domain-containing protein [Streptosporangiaceae bacterium]|jgi:hypothetical protein